MGNLWKVTSDSKTINIWQRVKKKRKTKEA